MAEHLVRGTRISSYTYLLTVIKVCRVHFDFGVASRRRRCF